MRIKTLFNSRGVSMMELLIAVMLLGLVLAGAASIHTSGAQFVGRISSNIRTVSPPSVNAITKVIDLGNQVTVTQSAKQLNVQCDCNPDLTPQTNGPGVGDTWFHFAVITSTQGGTPTTDIRWVADQVPNTIVTTSHAVLISDVNQASSSFLLINPSNQGTNMTVVQTLITFTSPVTTLKTQTALAGGVKR